jgi:hypothetical protein
MSGHESDTVEEEREIGFDRIGKCRRKKCGFV